MLRLERRCRKEAFIETCLFGMVTCYNLDRIFIDIVS